MTPSKPASHPDACVVAVTATYRRPLELARLLRSLEESEVLLHAIVVVDNADEEGVRSLAAGAKLRVEYLSPGSNLGCGGGLRAGEQLALERFATEWTHLWILDDDAVIHRQTLGTLLAAMQAESADAAHPLVTDAAGELGWYPGLLDANKFRVIRRRQTPEEFTAACGAEPIPFSWAQGIALLVSRRALMELGVHRADYWVRGEDLEFSLRITHRFRGIYVPAARVQHLPPEPQAPTEADAEYPKHRAMLQNIAYTSLLPHGRRILRTVPGNWLRFLRTWGWTPRVAADALGAFWQGAVRRKPAGVDRK